MPLALYNMLLSHALLACFLLLRRELAMSKLSTKQIVRISLLSALAAILFFFDFSLPFVAPDFYKLDFSEVPVLIGGFLMGPFAAVIIELIKIVIIFIIKGSYTAGVGELANFMIGCSLILPIIWIQKNKDNKINIIFACIIGIISMAFFAALLNYIILIPIYAKVFHVPIEAYIEMGKQLNPLVVNLKMFIVLCVIPFNIIKGVLSSFIATILYLRIKKTLKRCS